MNEHKHQPWPSLQCWVCWGLYSFSPSVVGVPAVALMQDHGWERTVGPIAALLLFGCVLLLTADLIFRWRSFVFLICVTPLSLGLLYWTIEFASQAHFLAGGICNAGIVIMVLLPPAAVQLLGFAVGILALIVRLLTWGLRTPPKAAVNRCSI